MYVYINVYIYVYDIYLCMYIWMFTSIFSFLYSFIDLFVKNTSLWKHFSVPINWLCAKNMYMFNANKVIVLYCIYKLYAVIKNTNIELVLDLRVWQFFCFLLGQSN